MIASTSISSIVAPRYSTLRRGNDLEILELRLGVAAAVGLDEADDDVEAARAERVRLLQHLVGLAHTGRGADVDAQPRALLLLDAREQRVGGRALVGMPVIVTVPMATSSRGAAHRARG